MLRHFGAVHGMDGHAVALAEERKRQFVLYNSEKSKPSEQRGKAKTLAIVTTLSSVPTSPAAQSASPSSLPTRKVREDLDMSDHSDSATTSSSSWTLKDVRRTHRRSSSRPKGETLLDCVIRLFVRYGGTSQHRSRFQSLLLSLTLLTVTILILSVSLKPG